MRASIAILVLVVSAATAAAQAPARRKLTFFTYQNAASAKEVEAIASTVRRKVIIAARPHDLGYLEHDPKPQTLLPAANRLRFWTDNQSLLLIGGEAVRAPQVTLLNEVFLGTLGSQLPNPIFINVSYDPANFWKAKDSISALALYAVGMERLARGDKSKATFDLFGEALTIIKLVEQNSEDDDITTLREAIEARLRSPR
jgi:hypothetical protein